MSYVWLTAEDIIALHSRLIEKSGGINGLRDRDGLESAIAAPLQTFGGQDFYPTVIEKVARLGYGLASNHAFFDGNKRIGALAMQVLLRENGFALELQPGELAKMFLAIADGSANEEYLLRWMQGHLAK